MTTTRYRGRGLGVLRAAAVLGACGLFAACAPSMTTATKTAAGEDPDGPLVPPPATDTVIPAVADASDMVAAKSGAVAEDSTFGAYLASRYAEHASNYEAAATLLDRVIEETPDEPRLLRRALVANISAGRFERAATLAERIRDEGLRDTALAALTRAARALGEGAYDRAASESAGADRTGMARYAAPVLAAWAEAGRGNPDAAIEELGALAGDGGFDKLIALHTALIQKTAGRYDAAIATLTAGDVGAGEMPTRSLRALARVHLANGNAAAAEKALADYVAANAESRIVDRDLADLRETGALKPLVADAAAGAADGLYHLASGVRQQADSIALVYARLSTYLDADIHLSRLLIADILQTRERYETAIAELERAAGDPAYGWPARLAIADNLIALERDAEAVERLEAMAGERPARIDALMKLGYLMRARERFAEGVEVYDRVISRLDDVGQSDWIAYYYRGITLERTDQWERAEADFLKALELKPGDPYVLNYLGYSWVDKGMHIERAKEMIRSAVEQRQNDGYIVDSLGWVHYKLGNYGEAVDHLERAVQLRPQDPVINDHLGDAYWRVGRRHEARFQWDRVLSLDPDDELAETVAEKLEDGLKGASGPPAN